MPQAERKVVQESLGAALSLLTPKQRLVAQWQLDAYAKDKSLPTNEDAVRHLQAAGFLITAEDLVEN